MRRHKKLIWASATHFMVDFICAWMIINKIPGSESWYLKMLVYNFLAFAGQLPAGILLDRITARSDKAGSITASAGCFLCLAVLLTGADSFALIVTAGIGNALFHVGSGAGILRKYHGRASASGIFVSTGALGIYAGSVIPMINRIFIPVAVILFMLTVYSLRLTAAEKKGSITETRSGQTNAGNGKLFSDSRGRETLSLICLFLVVVLRSFEGSIFSFPWNDSIITGFFLTGAVFLGKMLGGFASDVFGSLQTAAVSLGIAAILLAVSDHMGAALIGVLLFNMTMPVTLSELYRKLSAYPGTAFGLLTFALYLGVLPLFSGTGEVSSPAVYAVLTVISLILIITGLLLPNPGTEKRTEKSR